MTKDFYFKVHSTLWPKLWWPAQIESKSKWKKIGLCLTNRVYPRIFHFVWLSFIAFQLVIITTLFCTHLVAFSLVIITFECTLEALGCIFIGYHYIWMYSGCIELHFHWLSLHLNVFWMHWFAFSLIWLHLDTQLNSTGQKLSRSSPRPSPSQTKHTLQSPHHHCWCKYNQYEQRYVLIWGCIEEFMRMQLVMLVISLIMMIMKIQMMMVIMVIMMEVEGWRMGWPVREKDKRINSVVVTATTFLSSKCFVCCFLLFLSWSLLQPFLSSKCSVCGFVLFLSWSLLQHFCHLKVLSVDATSFLSLSSKCFVCALVSLLSWSLLQTVHFKVSPHGHSLGGLVTDSLTSTHFWKPLP